MTTSDSKRPNLILLCADEMNYEALRSIGSDPRAASCLSGLASQSVTAEHCYTVHPKCVPSRVALLSGQYPHVNGHRTLDLPARRHETNLVRELRGHGYRTTLFGRNHVVDDETMPETFAEWFPRRGSRQGDPTGAQLIASGLPVGSYYVGEDRTPLAEHVDVCTTDDAVDWIQRRDASDPPFFAWVNWECPHPPYGVPAPYFGRTDRNAIALAPIDDPAGKPDLHATLIDAYRTGGMSADDWREVRGVYLDMCALIDEQVQRIVDALDAKGLREDTVLVFLADHGDFAGTHQLPEKWDTCFYDCITRIPLIVHAPGRLEPRRTDALIETIDVLPTMMSLAGLEPPPTVQGHDLTPVFRGESTGVRDEVLCQGGQEAAMLRRLAPADSPRPCEAYKLKQLALVNRPAINARAKMIRDHQYKYVYRLEGIEELYDMCADPDELSNLAGDDAHRSTLDHYRQRLLKRLVEAESIEPYQAVLES